MSDEYPVRSTAKVYKDSDGNDKPLWQMVRDEPEWAKSRIQDAEIAEKEISRLQSELEQARKVTPVDFIFQIPGELGRGVIAAGCSINTLQLRINNQMKYTKIERERAEKAEAENAELRECLKFYADAEIYLPQTTNMYPNTTEAEEDGGQKARKTLNNQGNEKTILLTVDTSNATATIGEQEKIDESE